MVLHIRKGRESVIVECGCHGSNSPSDFNQQTILPRARKGCEQLKDWNSSDCTQTKATTQRLIEKTELMLALETRPSPDSSGCGRAAAGSRAKRPPEELKSGSRVIFGSRHSTHWVTLDEVEQMGSSMLPTLLLSFAASWNPFTNICFGSPDPCWTSCARGVSSANHFRGCPFPS